MVRQHVQHLLAFFFSMLADLAAQDIFIPRLMRALIELEAAAQLRLLDRPSGQHLRQFGTSFCV